jgi:hypothetical protein
MCTKIALDLFIRYIEFVFHLECLKKLVFYLFSLKYSYYNSTTFLVLQPIRQKTVIPRFYGTLGAISVYK